MVYSALADFVRTYRGENPRAFKQAVAAEPAQALQLTKHRSVYACDQYAARFSSASGKSFSNVVLSLSALRKFDSIPFIVVLLRPDSTEFFLANTTFLKKISHSSHQLRVGNIRGSFLGHDIMRNYEGIPNCPENFDALFAIHQEFSWEENLERLVKATSNIAGTGKRFSPNNAQVAAILKSPDIAAALVDSEAYLQVKQELAQIVEERSDPILTAAKIDNINVRGNQIEQLITGGINEHGLADMICYVNQFELQLEIKTKLMDRASSPKAYNIDKALETLSNGETVIAFCFVGIYSSARRVTASTVSIFDNTVLDATRVQFHWAGRNSRGVTQLTGDLVPLFAPAYGKKSMYRKRGVSWRS